MSNVKGKIMDYEKYSKRAFKALKRDESLINQLLQELDSAIESELHDHIASKMQEIVDQLNKQGHKLDRNVDLEKPGSTDFCETHGADNCGFHIGSDVTIYSGYYGVSDVDEFEE